MNEAQLKLIAKMRDYQKQYFEARQRHMHVTAQQLLIHCKDYEARVDLMVKEGLGQAQESQIKLF